MDRPRQHLAFHVAAKADVIVGRLCMRDPYGVLFNDRAFVEVRRNIMRGCADKLNAAFEGLLIGVRALEAGQEGMMDVDDPTRHLLAQGIRQDLHVAGKYHEIGVGIFDHGQQTCFGLGLVLLGHLDVVEGNIVVHHDLLVIEVVRNHRDDLDRQRADAPAVQQVVQAVAKARYHQHDLHLFGGVVEIPSHPECLGDRAEPFAQLVDRGAGFAVKADARKEVTGLGVVELMQVPDIASLLRKIGRDLGDDAAPGGAVDGQDVVVHSVIPWIRP